MSRFLTVIVQADTVTTMILGEGGRQKTGQRPGSVSRDRKGRIRSERVTSKYKVKTGDDTGKEVEGFDAEGRRRVEERDRGTDDSGREIPEKANDQWCAPELQAVVLQVSQDVGREVTEFKNIRRVDPDPSLFEIPQDYTILEKTTWPYSKTPGSHSVQSPTTNPG
jgi:hypothetical protein